MNFKAASLGIASLAGVAAAQSAAVNVSASSTSVAAGDTVSITVSADFDTAGAPRR